MTEATKFNVRTVEDLKAEGLYFAAGALQFQLGYPGDYGCHYGFRSDRDNAVAEFFRGYDAAKIGAKR